MRKTALVPPVVLILLLVLSQVHLAQTGGTIDLSWHVMGSGGATTSFGGTTQVGGTLGQFAPGSASGAAANLRAGFWQEDEAPTAVTLVSFTATAAGGGIVITWETATEIDMLGFHLYRAEETGGPETRLNGDLIPGQAAGSPLGAVYEFVDGSVASGVTYRYWLEDVDIHGRPTRHGPITALAALENPWRLHLPVVRR